MEKIFAIILWHFIKTTSKLYAVTYIWRMYTIETVNGGLLLTVCENAILITIKGIKRN